MPRSYSFMAVYAASAVGCLLLSLAGMPFQATAKKPLPTIYGPIPLESHAEKSQFVVLATVGLPGNMGGYCTSSGSDWRAWMPIYLATALGKGRPLLIWDNHPLGNRPGSCRLCLTGDQEEASTFFDCKSWLKSRGLTTTHLMLISGTGRHPLENSSKRFSPKHYPDVYKALHQPWVDTRGTRVLHFPITHVREIMRNAVFTSEVKHFDVIQDGSWLHPVHRGDLEAWTNWCQAQPRSPDLLYIAHFHSLLGQQRFLAAADPDLLQGYTIHFYNVVHYSPVPVHQEPGSTADHLKATAKSKGINIVIHSEPASVLDFSIHSCRAMGLIHFPVVDANPRSVHEALANGLPVFVSKQAHLPLDIRKQGFVQLASSSDTGLSRMNEDLRHFMQRIVVDRRLGDKVFQFAKEKLNPAAAYYTLFEQVGIARQRGDL